MKTALRLLALFIPFLGLSQSEHGSGFLPSLDKRFTFSRQGQDYYLVSLSDSTLCESYLSFNPDSLPQEDYELYQYTVEESFREIEFLFYDRRLIEQQIMERGKIYDKER